jgi:hypothetical protein
MCTLHPNNLQLYVTLVGVLPGAAHINMFHSINFGMEYKFVFTEEDHCILDISKHCLKITFHIDLI